MSGGYKGYGLAMLVEIFCGILAGSEFGPKIRRWKDTNRVANLVNRSSYFRFRVINAWAIVSDAAWFLIVLFSPLFSLSLINNIFETSFSLNLG